MIPMTEQSAAAYFLLSEALWCERSSQLQEDPTVTEEALIAEDVKADIYQEEGGCHRARWGREAQSVTYLFIPRKQNMGSIKRVRLAPKKGVHIIALYEVEPKQLINFSRINKLQFPQLASLLTKLHH